MMQKNNSKFKNIANSIFEIMKLTALHIFNVFFVNLLFVI